MRRALFFLPIAGLALYISLGFALAQDFQLPCRFHGTVQLDGADVPDGTVITATIQGDTYSTTTPSVYGDSTYLLEIVPHYIVHYAEMVEITFKIDGYATDQTGEWETGGNRGFNLSAAVIPTPAPSEPAASLQAWVIIVTIFGLLFVELLICLLWKFYSSGRGGELQQSEEPETQ